MLSATVWICSASMGIRVRHMATVTTLPTHCRRKRKVSRSASEANW